MGRLDGQVAVIMGGASGIGEATVRLFVGEGARVAIADIQDERGERLARELGKPARFLHTDVTSEADVKAVIARAVEEWGRLDCMFNNAGIPGAGGGIENIAVDAFDHTIAVLLRGVFLGMKHAAPIMRTQGSGTIINTASVAGIRTGHAGHVYSAAKAAVIHLTRSVAQEVRGTGVRVNCICPGFIATPIFARALGLPPETDDRFVSELQRGSARMGRPGRPEEIANAALWLASDESSFVNGHALVVDDGETVGRSWSEMRAWAGQMRAATRSELDPAAD